MARARWTAVAAGVALLSSALAGPAAAFQDGAPEMLIVARRAPAEGDADPNAPVADFLAEQLAAEGRVRPVVWSLTDPVFRVRVEEDRALGLAEGPTPDRVRRAARAFGAAYVAWVSAVRREGRLTGRIELYRGGDGRAFWTDDLVQSIATASLADWDNATASMARTWVQRMGQGPLRDRPARALPPPAEETAPPPASLVAEAPVPRRAEFNPEILARAQDLARQGRASDGILLLREAVDGAPMDVSARAALVEALLAADRLEAAAGEARRAAALLPEAGRFRLVAARAWLRLGRLDEARADLDEALARDAGGAETQVLVGDLRLAQGDPEAARSAYDAALAKAPGFDARFGRALAAAWLGDADAVRADLAALPAASDAELANARTRARELLAARFAAVAEEVRLAQQAGRMVQRPADLPARVQAILRRTGALAELAARSPAPPAAPGAPEDPAAGRWNLACALLVQAAAETAALAAGDADAGADAALTLGEALRQAEAARLSPAAPSADN